MTIYSAIVFFWGCVASTFKSNRGFSVVLLMLFGLAGIRAQTCSELPARIAAAAEDTNLVNLLNSYVKCLNNTNMDSALAVNRRAVELASRLDFKRGLLFALVGVKGTLLRKAQYDDLKKRVEWGEAISRTARDTAWLCRFQYISSEYYLYTGAFDRSAEIAIAVLQVAERRKDERLIPLLLGNIANAQFGAGQYEKALETHLKRLALAERGGRPIAILGALADISIVYSYLRKDWDTFLEYNRRGIALAKELNEQSTLSILTNNLALYYYEKDPKDPKAQQTYEEGRHIAALCHDDRNQADAALSLARIYLDANDLIKAEAYAKEGNQIAQKVQDINLLAVAATLWGDLEHVRKSDDSAIESYEKSLELQKKGAIVPIRYPTLTKMASAYAAKGDYQKAFEYAERGRRLNDSLFTQESALKLSKIENQYRLERKDNELKLLGQEKDLQDLRLKSQASELERRRLMALSLENNQRLLARENELQSLSLLQKSDSLTKQQLAFQLEQADRAIQLATAREAQQAEVQRRRTWVGILVGLLGIAVLLIFIFRARAQFERVRLRGRMAMSEMKALRAQMNPHFIFNSLNSINAYILHKMPAEASGYLTEFAHLMRQILDNSARETIPLEQEIAFLESYLKTESLRLENKLTYHIRVADSVDTFETEIPSMILQPYVENAIWHGISPKPDGGQVLVSMERMPDGALLLSVEDNGVGREQGRALRAQRGGTHESKGLKITEERLALYDQRHKTKSVVKTMDLADERGRPIGTRVEIRMAPSAKV